MEQAYEQMNPTGIGSHELFQCSYSWPFGSVHEEQCPWDSDTSYGAAVCGHFEMNKWLHDKQCSSWDEESCVGAALGGNSEILKSLHEKHEET